MRKLTPEEAVISKARSAARVKAWVLAHPERRKEISRNSATKNRHKHVESSKAWKVKNAAHIRNLAKIRYYKDHAKTLAKFKAQRDRNPAVYRANLKRRDDKNRAEKNNAYLASRMRARVYGVLRGKIKSAPTLVLLGCPLDLFRLHLQNKFRDGMAWNNYGSYWHIDHIRPCASFDLSKAEEQRKCFHYTNLQPLTAFENKSKGDKYVS